MDKLFGILRNINNVKYVNMKKCSKCGVVKNDSEFYRLSKQSDKLYSSCKECKKKVSNKNYISSPRKLKKTNIPNEQICSCCKKKKNITDFRFRKIRGYYDTICLECKRIKHIIKTYNVSKETAYKLHNKKECSICSAYVEGSNQCVDHNHNTGKVRDILCNNCNRAIGYFNEDIDKMEKAINYLIKHE